MVVSPATTVIVPCSTYADLNAKAVPSGCKVPARFVVITVVSLVNLP